MTATIRIALGTALLVSVAAHQPASAQLSNLDQSSSTATNPQANSVDGFSGFSTSVPIPNDGTTFQSRFAFNVNADVGTFSTRDESMSATHRVDFDATAPGGYRLVIDTRRVGDLNRLSDVLNCDGNASVSDVTGSSNLAVHSGTLSLGLANPPLTLGNGTSTISQPINELGSATIYNLSNGVLQAHELTFTWTASVRSNSCEAAVRGGEQNGTTTSCTACGYPGSPGRTQSTDGHFVTVTFTSLCGNGAIDVEVAEQCDDGNLINGDCCSSICQTEAPCVTTTTTSTTIPPPTGLSGVDQSLSAASGTAGNDADSFAGFSTSFPVPNDGTTFQSRFAHIVNADTAIFSTRDKSSIATHRLDFNAMASGGYRLDVQHQRVGDMNRINDASGCDGSADITNVIGSSSVALSSGTLSLPDPGSVPNAGSTISSPFNQLNNAVIHGVANGVAQSHTLTFTWTANARSNSCEAAVRLGEQNGTTTSCTACDYPGSPPRTQSTDGHFVTVTFTSLCGNGAIDAAVGEQCDDGNTASGDCCSSSCQTEVPCSTTTSTTIASTTTSTALASSTTSSTTVTPTTTAPTTTSTTTLPICAAAPVAGCRTATALKSSVALADNGDDLKDLFKWKWKGAATAVGDFKDPLDGTPEISVCVYDGNSGVLLEARILPGGTCSDKPCWKRLGKIASPTGYKYKNKLATPHGLTDAALKAGIDGKAQIGIKGKGIHLQMPTLGNVPVPVTVQLVIEDGIGTECWETTYGTTIRNDSVQLKAKGP